MANQLNEMLGSFLYDSNQSDPCKGKHSKLDNRPCGRIEDVATYSFPTI